MSNEKEDKKFKKGQSGNPNGRPKKGTTVTELLRKQLENFVVVDENGKKIKKKYNKALADVIAQKAIKDKDLRFIELWIDRIEGKPKQPIDVENTITFATVEIVKDNEKSQN